MIFNRFSKLADIYNRHPLLANSFSGFFIYSAADVVCQYSDSQKQFKLDSNRALEAGVFGFVMNGIVILKWYKLLDKSFGTGTTYKIVFMKTVADQVIFAPFNIISYFLFVSIRNEAEEANNSSSSTTSTSSNNHYQHIYDNFHKKVESLFVSTYIVDSVMWPIVNIVNFKYIPFNYRPTFAGCAQLLWQTYLTYVANCSSQSTLQLKIASPTCVHDKHSNNNTTINTEL